MTLLVLITVCLLGHSSFGVRERATSKLSRYIDFAPHVVLAAERHQNPEVAQRARMVSDRWIKANAETLAALELPSNWSHFPWIDLHDYVHFGGSHDWYIYWLNQAKNTPDDFSDWPRWREATRLWVVYQVASRQPIRDVLREMCERERDWCRVNGRAIPPAPKWKS